MGKRSESLKGVILSLLLVFGVFLGGYLLLRTLVPPVPQSEKYHKFADTRICFGIPYCGDVLSNAAFFLAGVQGLLALSQATVGFQNHGERLPFYVIFIANLFIALGSAYYHWRPTTETLFWDRLPMTFAFTASVAALINDFIGPRAGKILLVPLLITGFVSVVQWRLSEIDGAGDLRLYYWTQAFPLVSVLPVFFFFSPRYTYARYTFLSAALYVGAKVVESYDHPIFLLTGQLVSGHTLKHFVAALSVYFMSRMISLRTPLYD